MGISSRRFLPQVPPRHLVGGTCNRFFSNLSPYFWTFSRSLILLPFYVKDSPQTCKFLSASFPWVGIFIAFEWHLVWAGLSGMETLLHGLIVTTVLILLMTNSPRYLTLGLLTGLSVWARPDGLTLLGPALMTIFFVEQGTRSRLSAMMRYSLGFIPIFGLYLLFNLAVGGTPMPNTFYAKQASTQPGKCFPFPTVLDNVFATAGPKLVLDPGVGWLVKSIRRCGKPDPH